MIVTSMQLTLSSRRDIAVLQKESSALEGAEDVNDKGFDLRHRARTCRVHPERAHDESRHTFPVVLRSAYMRIKEDEAQDIALPRRPRSIVGQHHSRRPVPGDHVPRGGPDESGTRLQRIEHALQPRRDAFFLAAAHCRRAAEAEQKKMLTLDIGQHQGPRRTDAPSRRSAPCSKALTVRCS
jgi:hypothetical protein